MSTKLPKISAYIPQELYKCLQKDKQKTGMSLSQVIIAALANHYNLEETIGKGGRRVIVGGETSNRITALEKQVGELSSSIEDKFSEFAEILSQFKSSSVSTNGLPNNKIIESKLEKDEVINELPLVKKETVNNKQPSFESEKTLTSQTKKDNQEVSIKENSQLELVVESSSSFEPLTGPLLAKRLGVGKSTPASIKARRTPEQFCQWSVGKDPGNIGWIPNPDGTGYVPAGELTESQLKELRIWIAENN